MRGILGVAALVAACALPAAAPAAGRTVEVQLLALNDFHGHVETAPSLATQVRRLRAQGRTFVVSAGDLFGGSPLVSAAFHDEPTIEAMNLLGLDFNAVGNHELDEGAGELVRLAGGGCHPDDGCRDGDAFDGARFGMLAANTLRSDTGQTLFPPFAVRRVGGVRIAFVGLTLEGTPSVVAPGGAAGLAFRDEADTVNALVPELRRRGVEAIVVLLHEGGAQAGGIDACEGISGPVVDIVARTSPAVDLFVTGHTHEAYDCVIAGRPVTSAGANGRLLTDVDLTLDRRTGDVARVRTDNLVVGGAGPPDRRQVALLDKYRSLIAPLAERVVASTAAPLGREALGALVADAQLAATRATGDAEVALVNPSGVRAELDAGPVTYEELFAVQPFGLHLVTMTLTGPQLRRVFEQQTKTLLVPTGFDPAAIDAERSYRVTVSSFLAAGGDGFTVLLEGTDRTRGVDDVEALQAHLGALSPVNYNPRTPEGA